VFVVSLCLLRYLLFEFSSGRERNTTIESQGTSSTIGIIPFAGENETFVADAASVGVYASCVGHGAQTSHFQPCGVE
jgi:hypothetical protein